MRAMVTGFAAAIAIAAMAAYILESTVQTVAEERYVTEGVRL